MLPQNKPWHCRNSLPASRAVCWQLGCWCQPLAHQQAFVWGCVGTWGPGECCHHKEGVAETWVTELGKYLHGQTFQNS